MLDLNFDETPVIEENTDNDKKITPDLYKKWFKSPNASGFLSVKPLLNIGKFRIDIGATGQDSSLKSHTETFVDAVLFAVYLRSIVAGTAETLYLANAKLGVPTNEGIAFYGGGKGQDGKPISRIFKSHWWRKGENEYDRSSFVFKCGHFKANQSSSGAFLPDMSSPLSTDSIKVTRIEMAEISYRVDLAISGYASSNQEWFTQL
jgi:hypothetical protein